MTDFTETFEYANGDLDTVSSAAWGILDENDAEDGIEVFQRAATNKTTDVAYACYTTPAETADQEVAAWVCWHEQTSTAYVDIGCAGTKISGTPPAYADLVRGLYARLHWKPDGVRTLSIRRFFSGDTADTELATVELVNAGGVEAEGYEGRLRDAGALGALQQVRLVMTAASYGTLVRAYVNENDDDRPTLSALVTADFIYPTGSSYGCWWFGFGTPSAARVVEIAQVGAADYTVTADKTRQEIREDQVRLAELRKRVRAIYEKGQNSTTTDERIDYALNDEVEDAINRAGDVAWFMRRQASVSLTPSTLGEVTMATKMRRVIDMSESTTGAPVVFEFRRQTTDGALVLCLPCQTAATYLVDYIMRHQQMADEMDVCPVPREYTEMIVVGAALRLAEVDRNAGVHKNLIGRYGALSSAYMRDLNRHTNQTRNRFAPLLRGPVVRRAYRRRMWQ